MATFTAFIPSGSTDGRNVKVAATATPGTTVHTATTGAGTDTVDEVWIWATSTSSATINLTVHTNELNDDGNAINVRVPAAYNGPVQVMAGQRFRNGVVLTATASVANRVNLMVNINRIVGQG